MTDTDPTRLGDLLAGDARAAMPIPRAPLDPSRIGVERVPLPRYVRAAVLVRDRFACAWCGHADERGRGMEIDHIVPWSAGGSDHPVNLRTLCGPHNQERSNRYSKELDLRSAPIVWVCDRCEPSTGGPGATVDAFCLRCLTTAPTAYRIRMTVGGRIPDAGVPLPKVVLGSGLDPAGERLLRELTVRAETLGVACPWCSAKVGEPCWLTRSGAHPSRIAVANGDLYPVMVRVKPGGSVPLDRELVRGGAS